MPHRLLLIDDHLMMTEALAAGLASVPDVRVIGCRTWGDASLLDAVRWLRPEAIMFELPEFADDAGHAVRALLNARPSARLIVLSAVDDVAEGIAAARAGADAWVSKHASIAELVSALTAVLHGGSCYPPAMLGPIMRELRSDVQRAEQRVDPLSGLTRRERDVLACMVGGERDRQIATRLNISADTARTHARNIFAKLGVKSRLEAVTLAVQAGLQPAVAPAAPAELTAAKRAAPRKVAARRQ